MSPSTHSCCTPMISRLRSHLAGRARSFCTPVGGSRTFANDTLISSAARVVIPVAGRATRMLPLSRAVPKCLLPVPVHDGSGAVREVVPLLHHLLRYEVVQSFGGRARVAVVVEGPQQSDRLEVYFAEAFARLSRSLDAADRALASLSVSYVVQPTELAGLGGAVLAADRFCADGPGPFYVLLGDHAFSYNDPSALPALGRVARAHFVAGPTAFTSAVGQCADAESGLNGIVTLDGVDGATAASIVALSEKPDPARADELRSPRLPPGRLDCFFGVDCLEPAALLPALEQEASAARASGREICLRAAMKRAMSAANVAQGRPAREKPCAQGVRVPDGTRLDVGSMASYSCLFAGRPPAGAAITRDEPASEWSPGRIDIMGGFSDNNGGTVLQLPTLGGTSVCWAPVSDAAPYQTACVELVSDTPVTRTVRVPCELLLGLPIRRGPRAALRALARVMSRRLGPDERWVLLPLGCAVATAAVCAHTGGLAALSQARVTVRGSASLPQRAGVASSAALEVASVRAVARASGLAERLPAGVDLAKLCQLVEREAAGQPCGIMDQATLVLDQPRGGGDACRGRERLLHLQCSEPAEVLGHLGVPKGLAFFGMVCGARPPDAWQRYAATAAAAAAGRRVLVEAGVLEATEPLAALPACTSHAGFAAEADGAALVRELERLLPERLVAAGGVPVRAATLFAARESARTRALVAVLDEGAGNGTARGAVAERAGALLRDSKRDYDACGLGHPGADAIATMLDSLPGVAGVLHGGRMSGAGCGGTVVIVATEGGETDAAIDVLRRRLVGACADGGASDALGGAQPGRTVLSCLH